MQQTNKKTWFAIVTRCFRCSTNLSICGPSSSVAISINPFVSLTVNRYCFSFLCSVLLNTVLSSPIIVQPFLRCLDYPTCRGRTWTPQSVSPRPPLSRPSWRNGWPPSMDGRWSTRKWRWTPLSLCESVGSSCNSLSVWYGMVGGWGLDI